MKGFFCKSYTQYYKLVFCNKHVEDYIYEKCMWKNNHLIVKEGVFPLHFLERKVVQGSTRMENMRKYVKMKGSDTIYKMDCWISEKCQKIKHPSKGILKIELNNRCILLYAFFFRKFPLLFASNEFQMCQTY